MDVFTWIMVAGLPTSMRRNRPLTNDELAWKYFGEISVHHKGDIVTQVIEGTYQVLKRLITVKAVLSKCEVFNCQSVNDLFLMRLRLSTNMTVVIRQLLRTW